MSCFLRGDVSHYPQRLKQGSLVLSGTEASWTPFWSIRRHPLAIQLVVKAVESRHADNRERFRVKKGGKAYGVVEIPTFYVVTCRTDVGSVDFVVPHADEPLVRGFFTDRTAR